jgi:Protein of unknown function (DUF2911)
MQKKFAFVVSIFAVFALSAVIAAQMKDKSQRPSPPEQAQCKFSDGKTVTINYSSPRAKGRKIFGGLVPYGEVWRTGANEATALVTTANLSVGSTNVPAGNYTLFTIPNQNKWTLIINKKTGEWGIPYKYESDELGRSDMSVSQTPSPVEDFTISFDQSGTSCAMNITWENTKASAQLKEAQ